MKRFFYITIFLIAVKSLSFSQDISSGEAKLQQLFEKLFYASTDRIKDSLNHIILIQFEETLNKDTYTFVNFKKIKNISFLVSDDKELEIVTWTINYSNNIYKYYGFVKYYSRIRETNLIEQLIDTGDLNETNSSNILTPDNWYGSVYYEIISKNYKGEKHYIVLGWDGNDQFTNKKVLDVIWIEDQEHLVFGKPIFNTGNTFQSRFIYEYGERVSMILNYNTDLKMIIWDHLSPAKQELKGHFEYYGPDLTYDGLIFEKGIWKLISDVDLTKNGKK